MCPNMKDVMGVLVLIEPKDKLKELTVHRSLAAVPFGARYRLIDFALSNLVNAGIRNVGVFVQDKYRSLMDHLGIGQEWDLNRKRDGLFILPPEKFADGTTSWLMNGDILMLRLHLDYLARSKQEYVILMTSPVIWNVDLMKVMEFHLRKNADVTMVYHLDGKDECVGTSTEINTDDEGKVTQIMVNPLLSQSSQVLLDTFIIKRQLLMELIDIAIALGGNDFVRDILIRNLEKLKIYGWEFNGYAEKITSLECYYRTSMELLDSNVYQEVFFKNGPIFTKIKNEPPTIYADTAVVNNSLIANGCKIEGTVENSILFRGVKIGKNAVVKNSIVMQKAEVKEKAILEYVIIDKDSTISEEKRLIGAAVYPLVIGKGTTL